MDHGYGRVPQGRRAAEGGFSLLEVIIAAVLLFLMIGVTAAMLGSGQTLLQATSIGSAADIQAQETLTKIVERIRNGSASTIEDGAGVLIADGTTVTNGLRVRKVVSFTGGATLGPTVWIAVTADGEGNVTNEVDDDRDGIHDERQIRVREWPGDDSVGTPVDVGGIGKGMGLLDPADARPFPKRILSPLTVTRTGDRLTLTVGVLKKDPKMLDADGKPVVRCFRATTHVLLKN